MLNSDTCSFLQRPRNQPASVFRVLSGGPASWVSLAEEPVRKKTHLSLAPHPGRAPPAPRVSEGKPPSLDGLSWTEPREASIPPSCHSQEISPGHSDAASQGSTVPAAMSDVTTASLGSAEWGVFTFSKFDLMAFWRILQQC